MCEGSTGAEVGEALANELACGHIVVPQDALVALVYVLFVCCFIGFVEEGEREKRGVKKRKE